jgi:uncharacterized repeat protein (TIGR01451 family)
VPRKLVVGLIIAVAVVLTAPALASADATFNVQTIVDGNQAQPGSTSCATSQDSAAQGLCTLRSSIEAADHSSGAVTVNVPAGTYTLSETNPIPQDRKRVIAAAGGYYLDITPGPTSVSILGAGAGSTIVDANYLDRAFQIENGATATISGLTVEHGRPGGVGNVSSCSQSNQNVAPGGGVLNYGTLALTGDVITDNIAAGSGGGVEDESTAPVSVSGTTISDNQACVISGAFSISAYGFGGGFDDAGVNLVGGTVRIDSSTISGNGSQGDGGGVNESTGFCPCSRPAARGAAPHSSARSASHSAHQAARRSSSLSAPHSAPRAAPAGAAIAITNSTISGNQAAGNGGGVSGEGGFGSSRPTISLFADAVSGNTAGVDGGGVGGFDNDSILDSTITGNTSGPSGGGGVMSGYGSSDTISFSTVNANTASGGPGGNLLDQGNAITVDNSIVTAGVGTNGNPDNCFGTVVSGGYNLFDDNGSSCGTVAGDHDLINSNPVLGPLQNNGGPTSTEALQKGSPAIDAASGSACASEPTNSSGTPVDQRGVLRPEGLGCDIGAYEAQPDLAVTASVQRNPIDVGQQDTVTDTITNNTAATAPNVTFTDPGAGYVINSVTPSQGSCTHTANTVSCALGAMAPGSAATVTIVLTGTSAGTLTLTGVANMSDPEPSPAANTATVQITVIGFSADMAVRVTPSRTTVAAGQTFSYLLRVTNRGPDSAQKVKLTDELPGGVRLVSVAKKWHCHGKQKITCALGNMASGAVRKIRLTVRVSRGGKLVDKAQVAAASPADPYLANNHSKATVKVVSKPSVSIEPIGVVCPTAGAPAEITVIGKAGDGVRKVVIALGGQTIKTYTVHGKRTSVLVRASVAGGLAAGQSYPVTAVLTDKGGQTARASATLQMCSGVPS